MNPFIMLGIAGADWWMRLFTLPVIVSLVLLLLLTMRDLTFINLTLQGENLRYKPFALKRWLKDFTHLKEAIPQDVVIWNNLLVMTDLSGISEKVLKELQITLPDVGNNTSFVYYYPVYFHTTLRTFLGSSFGGEAFFSGLGTSIASADGSSGSSFGGGGGFGGGGSF